MPNALSAVVKFTRVLASALEDPSAERKRVQGEVFLWF